MPMALATMSIEIVLSVGVSGLSRTDLHVQRAKHLPLIVSQDLGTSRIHDRLKLILGSMYKAYVDEIFK